MLYLTCTAISCVDLAQYDVSHAKDWVSVDCGTNSIILISVIIRLYCIGPLYTDRLFCCYILDESISHLRVLGLFCCFYSVSDGKSCKQTV